MTGHGSAAESALASLEYPQVLAAHQVAVVPRQPIAHTMAHIARVVVHLHLQFIIISFIAFIFHAREFLLIRCHVLNVGRFGDQANRQEQWLRWA